MVVSDPLMTPPSVRHRTAVDWTNAVSAGRGSPVSASSRCRLTPSAAATRSSRVRAWAASAVSTRERDPTSGSSPLSGAVGANATGSEQFDK